MIGICSRSRVRNTSGDLFLCLLSTAAALDQFTILLMASPAFWMLRPKKKKKKTLESPLSVSHAPLSHLSGNSVDATFNTPPKFSSFPLCQLLPWTRPPAAPPGYSQPSTTASLSPLSTQSGSPGTRHSCHSFAQNPLPTSFTEKAKVPMVAYWSVPPLNIILAFSLWLCFSYICLLGIPWICQENSHFLPLYELSQWLEWSVPTICTAISFTPFKPLIK